MFSKKTKYFKKRQNLIKFSFIPWDSTCLNNTTLQIEGLSFTKGIDYKAYFESFYKSLRLKKGDLIFAKVQIKETNLIRLYNDLGFYFVEESIISEINLRNIKFRKYKKVNGFLLHKVTDKNIDFAVTIAGKAFYLDRYHIDKNLDPKRASYRYECWVRNSFNNNEDIFLFKNYKETLGFFILKKEKESVVNLRLIALDPAFKGKGYGKLMYVKMLEHIINNNFKKVISQISLNNISVLNIYTSFNAKFYDPLIILHKVI